jgi:hypothetical protein
VSAVTPAFAYLSRTVDLTIAGNGTNWSSATTVAFADPKITVNKVTAASPTGLLVNVTIGADTTVAATDVTVTDGGSMETYKGAFEIKEPLKVTITPAAGVPQGGFASVHVQMLDVTTPFDSANLMVSLNATDVGVGSTPTASGDYGMDFLVAADVMASSTDGIDIVVSSGPSGSSIDSPAKRAVIVAPRSPMTLAAGATGATGTVATTVDSSLFQFTPAAATQRFLQYTISSPDGGSPLGIMLPKSGKYADALGGFGVRFGLGTTSTDPMYLVLTDSGGLFSAPPPYGFKAVVTETAATALTFSGTHTDKTTALAIAALPALANGDLGAGTTTTGDWYKITVTAAAKNVHLASGGDGKSSVSLNLIDVDGTTSLSKDAMDDAHKDVAFTVSAAGTYFIQVMPDQYFASAHSKYELFVETK